MADAEAASKFQLEIEVSFVCVSASIQHPCCKLSRYWGACMIVYTNIFMCVNWYIYMCVCVCFKIQSICAKIHVNFLLSVIPTSALSVLLWHGL